jgi:copper chaperone CopZ
MRIEFQQRIVIALMIAVGQQERTMRITAEPMCCVGCGHKIAGQFYTVPGVKSVSLNYATKTLTVVFQQGRTPSPRLLCEAMSKTKDHPVKVAGAFGNISLEYPKPADTQQQARPTYTAVVLQNLRSDEEARRIATQIYAFKLVKSVALDLPHRTLFVTPHDGKEVSVWLVWEAVERAGDHALVIKGPSCTLKNDTLLAAKQARPQVVR